MSFSSSDYQLVDNVAADLIDRNGSTTTLDIKLELRNAYPGNWKQDLVSEVMQELSDVDGKYSWTDEQNYDQNNILRQYRRYTLPVTSPQDDDVPTRNITNDDDLPDDAVAISKANITNDLSIENTSTAVATPAPAEEDVTISDTKGSIINRLRRAIWKGGQS